MPFGIDLPESPKKLLLHLYQYRYLVLKPVDLYPVEVSDMYLHSKLFGIALFGRSRDKLLRLGLAERKMVMLNPIGGTKGFRNIMRHEYWVLLLTEKGIKRAEAVMQETHEAPGRKKFRGKKTEANVPLVLAFLSGHPEENTESEIGLGTGLNEHALTYYLQELVKEKYLEVLKLPGTGAHWPVSFYKITGKGQELLAEYEEKK